MNVSKPSENASDRSAQPNPPNPGAFIGSMSGTMNITGDIVSPIDVVWEADERSDQNHPL